MNDFVTLSCPICGGKLHISTNTPSLICDNCGNELIVRRDADCILLEAYARCPNCGRNDMVQKVSAIIASHTHIDRLQENVYYITSDTSMLAQRLLPPQQPKIRPNSNSNRISEIMMSLISFGVFGTLTSIGEESWAGIIFSLFLIFISIYILIRNNIQKKKENNFRLHEHQRNIKLWAKAMKKWQLLYYCNRDDCVFIPGKSEYASASSMMDFLSK